MKKILFGTTALLAAGAFVSTAQASDPIKLSLGGYMEYWVAAANQDGDFANGVNGANTGTNNFDIQGESEVWFGGKTTLDNGMTIGVDVQLEAGSNDNGTDTIDESYLWVEGKYGKMILGSENDAAYLMHVNAPDASQMGGAYTAGESDTLQYLPLGASVSVLEQTHTFTGDANKITYFTPSFYGFQFGASYVPSNSTGGDDSGVAASESVAKVTNFDEALAFGATYTGSFAGVGVKSSLGYVRIDDHNSAASNSSDPIQEYGAGLSLSYQGFTLGGAVNRRVANSFSSAAATDGFAWDAGLMYAEGPYKVSYNYASSEVEGAAAAGEDTVRVHRIGGSYDLGPGVILFSELAYSSTKSEGTDVNDGAYGGVVGLHLNF
jgi:outer membrane protein OmpU